MSESVIVICAVPGTAHTPTPHLPMTSDELATTRIATTHLDATAAGAPIFHLPARNPETGLAGVQPETVSQFLHIIKCAR